MWNGTAAILNPRPVIKRNSPKMKMLQELHKEGRYYDNPVCLNCVKCTTGVRDESQLINIKK